MVRTRKRIGAPSGRGQSWRSPAWVTLRVVGRDFPVTFRSLPPRARGPFQCLLWCGTVAPPSSGTCQLCDPGTRLPAWGMALMGLAQSEPDEGWGHRGLLAVATHRASYTVEGDRGSASPRLPEKAMESALWSVPSREDVCPRWEGRERGHTCQAPSSRWAVLAPPPPPPPHDPAPD